MNTKTIRSDLSSLNTFTKETCSSTGETGFKKVKLSKDESNARVPVGAGHPIKSTMVSSVEKLICSGCTKYLLRFGSQCVLGVRDSNISFTFPMKKESIITANQREECSTGRAPCVE
jgi:hypothetical protein